MVFETRPRSDVFKVDATTGIPHVWYTEIFGSPTTGSIKNPLTAAYLRIDKGPPVSPPVYSFDEAGIVIEGEVNFTDETGNSATLYKGDTFLIRRGSDMMVSSNRHGVIFKYESQFMGQEIEVKVVEKSNLQ
ncbi:unnamed protein product [Fusarium graminearum]|nr:unnamed protein product [Fusarium graminearum]